MILAAINFAVAALAGVIAIPILLNWKKKPSVLPSVVTPKVPSANTSVPLLDAPLQRNAMLKAGIGPAFTLQGLRNNLEALYSASLNGRLDSDLSLIGLTFTGDIYGVTKQKSAYFKRLVDEMAYAQSKWGNRVITGQISYLLYITEPDKNGTIKLVAPTFIPDNLPVGAMNPR